jgi:NAD(P)-dependent dehydrogenase (short-subunit alcohol dehydrogenase family)
MVIESLKNRHFLVLGGSSGMGLAVATYLARARAVVTICGRDQARLEAAHQQLLSETGAEQSHIRSKAGDGRDAAAVDAAIAHAADASGRLDGVFVVAGGGGFCPVTEVTLEMAAEEYALNVFPLINTINSAVPRMKKAGGAIVALSSTAAVLSYPKTSYYGAAKAGLEHYARVAADELGEHKIRVNVVRSGFTKSGATAPFVDDEQFIRGFQRATPLGEYYGLPEDFGPMVSLLLSPDTRWITGQVFAIDGGLTLRGYGGGIYPAGMV